MLRGLYSATTALDASEKQQEVAAQNMAYSSTPGYRQRGLVFETFDRVLGRDATPVGDLDGTTVAQHYVDFRAGSVQHTGNQYDLALEGDGFFVLNGPRGLLYTRNGNFHLNARAELVSEGGYLVRNGNNGPITIPQDTLRFSVASDGTVTADDVQIGQIERARFNRPQALEPVGPTLFHAPPGAGLQPGTDRIMQGFRETSNVEPSKAVITMMVGLRYFEASQRALRAIAESVGLNTKPQ